MIVYKKDLVLFAINNMSIVKKLLITSLAVLALTACASNNELENDRKGSINTLSEKREHLYGSEVYQCEFDTITQIEPIAQEDGTTEVGYEITTQKPINLKFVIKEDEARLIGNGGESDLVLSRNDDTGIVMIERNGLGNIFTYNIFPDRGIGIWTKTNDMFGSIYSFISVGQCW